jgi:hypothetical protein
MALLIGVMPASVTAFAPLAPQAAATSSRQLSSPTTQRNLAVDPSDIASSVNQIADLQLQHPTMEALISTLYAGTAKLPEAHGHSQSLFGPIDVYLTKMQSIAPATKGTLPTVIEEAAIPDKIRGAFDFARRGDFVDPTNIVRIDGDAPPGFSKVDSFFPVLQSPPTSTDYQLGVMNQEVFNLRALQKVPIAAFITVLVDFFLVSPGMEIFKEEIEEDGDRIMQETAVTGVARVAVLAVVAGLTLILT